MADQNGDYISWQADGEPLRVADETGSIRMNVSSVKARRRERGQFLILFALAAAAMLGFTALTIDIGSFYGTGGISRTRRTPLRSPA